MEKGSLIFLLAGFCLCALAGHGGYLAFDEMGGKRYRKNLGRLLLFGGGPLGILLIVLGAP